LFSAQNESRMSRKLVEIVAGMVKSGKYAAISPKNASPWPDRQWYSLKLLVVPEPELREFPALDDKDYANRQLYDRADPFSPSVSNCVIPLGALGSP